MSTERLYRALLAAYPEDYRREFADEMLTAYRAMIRDARAGGFLQSARLLFREILGLMVGAVCEQWRAVGYPDPTIRFRRFDMRHEFRFPRSTVFFMTLVLGLIAFALERGRHIYSPLTGVYPSLFAFMLIAVAITAAAAALGWMLLRAMRRTGTQRLEDLEV